jgi:hypothetical protein
MFDMTFPKPVDFIWLAVLWTERTFLPQQFNITANESLHVIDGQRCVLDQKDMPGLPLLITNPSIGT